VCAAEPAPRTGDQNPPSAQFGIHASNLADDICIFNYSIGRLWRCYAVMMEPYAVPMDPIAEGRRNWVAHGCGPVEQVTAATALTRAQQIATGRMAPLLAEYDLTFAQLEVLVAVADHARLVGMGELGAMLGLHPTTTARTVARLERARYVERVDDTGDRRVTRVRASARGLAVAHAALTRLRDIGFGLDGWDEADTRRFTGLAGLVRGGVS
jgi:DNA-binding MarR family transcriptional regulator